MLACGCAWLRSRCAPLTAVAASLSERCRLRRNAGLCLTRGMRGYGERALTWVVYPNPAENVSGPLSTRLHRTNQPVLSIRNLFSTPRPRRLADI